MTLEGNVAEPIWIAAILFSGPRMRAGHGTGGCGRERSAPISTSSDTGPRRNFPDAPLLGIRYAELRPVVVDAPAIAGSCAFGSGYAVLAGGIRTQSL